MTDRIIFWLDASIVHFGIAKSIQERHDCILSAIIDLPNRRKEFFHEQKFVKFEKIWFYHDYINTNKKPNIKFLKQIEEKYHVNLWLLASNERLFYNYNDFYKFQSEEILSILEDQCRLYEKILEEFKPDFIIMVTNQHHNQLFKEICKAKGIKILMLSPSRLARKYMISNDDTRLESKPNLNLIDFKNTTLDELQNYLTKFNSFKEVKTLENEFTSSKLSLLKAAFQFLFKSKNTTRKTHYTYYGRTKLRVLLAYLTDIAKIKYRSKFIDKNFIHEIKNNEQFIFFPLHTEPEKTTLIDAPFHTDQLEIIKKIVKSLPIGYKLYVKEHAAMLSRGWRKISYYKQLMDLPNVVLVHPLVPPKEILQKCSLVITINGTAGLEAACYGKNSIVFGNVLYSDLSCVVTVKNFEDLPIAIRDVLQRKVNFDEVHTFLDYIDKNSFEFDWVGLVADELSHFFYGGYLADIEVSISKMQTFLQKHKNKFDALADEHIKKLR